MKILITGASGFIGTKLLAAIAEQYGDENILILSSKPQVKFNFILYNELFLIKEIDKRKLQSIDLIIHAGAYTPKSKSDSNDVNGCNGNVIFTDSLLKQPFLNLKKIIYLSTLDVYSSTSLISESSPTVPNSLYGLSKLYCEKMIESHCENYALQNQILRIGHVYGPGEDKYSKFLPLAINKMVKGEPIEIWGEGHELRSLIYIDDVIRACINSIELTQDVGVINIVGGKPISIANLVLKLVEFGSKKIDVVHKPLNGNTHDIVFDNTKMKTYLLEEEVNFDDGLKAEIEYVEGNV